MPESRKIAAILVADVVGYNRLAGADDDRTLARLRALRSDLIDPAIAVHNGCVVKRTGDGSLVEFRSVCRRRMLRAGASRRSRGAQCGRVGRAPHRVPDRRSSRRRRRGGRPRPDWRWRDQCQARRNIRSKARGFFDRSLAADPGNVDAPTGSVAADAADGGNSFATDPAAAFALAEAKVIRAVSLFPNYTSGHALLGYLEILNSTRG